MENLSLTKDQDSALYTFYEFIDSDEPYMVLSGFAGCGKTTLVNYILNRYEGTVTITAPTHKALSVLVNKTHSDNYDNASTIHSLLNLVIKKKNHQEVLEKNHSAEDKIQAYSLVVIDECSMIGTDLMEHIEASVDYYNALPQYNIKVLFVGDQLQLPPIGESISQSFVLPEFKANLTTVVRQALDNPIINLTVKIREAIKLKDEDHIPFKTNVHDGKGVQVYSKKNPFRDAMLKSVDEAGEEADYYKVISWRNRVVNSFNNKIRKHVYHGEPKEDFLVGEKVIINDPIMDGGIIIPRDTEGEIFAVEKIKSDKFTMITREDLLAYRLTIYIPRKDTYIKVLALDSVSKLPYDKALSYLATGKNWSAFWKLKEEFKDIRYIHSITSHKSQGSTYKKAFVDANDILSNPNVEEALKCFYVAVSRASDIAHIYYR